MEYFILELGLSAQPFGVNYDKYGCLVTHCWLKTIWEKCTHFEVQVRIGNILIDPPRAGDKWLMQCFVGLGYTGMELVQLNRVRLFQQVLFLSDILEAGGRYLDSRYRQPRPDGEIWSDLSFPEESPSTQDFALWESALIQVAPGGRVATALREFKSKGHKIWRWRIDDAHSRLIYLTEENEVEWYGPSALPGHVSRPNRWSLQEGISSEEEPRNICSVRELAVRGMESTRQCSLASPSATSDMLDGCVARLGLRMDVG